MKNKLSVVLVAIIIAGCSANLSKDILEKNKFEGKTEPAEDAKISVTEPSPENHKSATKSNPLYPQQARVTPSNHFKIVNKKNCSIAKQQVIRQIFQKKDLSYDFFGRFRWKGNCHPETRVPVGNGTLSYKAYENGNKRKKGKKFSVTGTVVDGYFQGIADVAFHRTSAWSSVKTVFIRGNLTRFATKKDKREHSRRKLVSKINKETLKRSKFHWVAKQTIVKTDIVSVGRAKKTKVKTKLVRGSAASMQGKLVYRVTPREGIKKLKRQIDASLVFRIEFHRRGVGGFASLAGYTDTKVFTTNISLNSSNNYTAKGSISLGQIVIASDASITIIGIRKKLRRIDVIPYFQNVKEY